jgi:chorismate synthase
LGMPEKTVDVRKKENITTLFSTRNDPTICARIYAVCEAMTRIALLDSIYMSMGYQKINEMIRLSR